MSLNEWTKFAPKPRELTPPAEWNVFLSYRSVDRTWVLNLYDVLRQHGYKVFLDQCVLKPGDELIIELQAALRKSQAGILIWSQATEESAWVSREYQRMETRATTETAFRFLPVTIDGFALPDFPANRIYLNFSSYPDGPNGGELLRLLYGLAGEPLSDEAAAFANQQDEASNEAADKVNAAIENGDDAHLVELFENGGLVWETSSAPGCKAAEGLLKLDKTDQAMTMLGKIQEQFPRAIRPRQLHALALLRRGDQGDLTLAQRILGELYVRKEYDPETLGIYARTWMDRYQQSGDLKQLRRSRDLYLEGFERTVDYYNGINAAAKSVLLGESEYPRAKEYAERVQAIVGTKKHPGKLLADGDRRRSIFNSAKLPGRRTSL